jgi:hypothetical protein
MAGHKRTISALDSYPEHPAKRPRTAPGCEGARYVEDYFKVQPTQQSQKTFSIEGGGEVPKNKANRLNSPTPRGRRGPVPSTTLRTIDEDGDEDDDQDEFACDSCRVSSTSISISPCFVHNIHKPLTLFYLFSYAG